MKEFRVSLDVLNDILDKKTPFSEALKSTFQTNLELRPMRALVSSLVGCELRHHLLLEFLCKDLKGFEEADRRAAYLALADLSYLKRISPEDCLKALGEEIGVEKLSVFKTFHDELSKRKDLIPETIDRSSAEYLSLRYNAPIWVVKVLQHYGFGNTFKTLRANARPEGITLRVSTSRISLEEVLKNPDFVATHVPEVVLYQGKEPIRKNEWYRTGKLFNEKPLVKALVDAYKVKEPCELFLYNGNADCSFERELIESYGSSIGLNLATPDTDKKVEVLKAVKQAGLHNVNFFSASDTGSMEAAISKKQDVVFCVPDSTNFDLIRSTPDYLLHFDRDGMDQLIANEKKALEDCAKYVEEDGTLVYVVFTISKKEGHTTVSNFIKRHQDFSLVEETQHFPFQEIGTSAYVAVLKHGPKLAKATPPLTDLSALAKESNVSLSASEK